MTERLSDLGGDPSQLDHSELEELARRGWVSTKDMSFGDWIGAVTPAGRDAAATGTQEIVEVRVDNFMRGSIKDVLAQDLAARPEHRGVALSTVAGGDEFNGVIRVAAVIEYL